MTSSFSKFLLLSWKNWKIQSRHKVQTLFEIFLPIAFIYILVILRSQLVPRQRSSEIFDAVNPSNCNPDNQKYNLNYSDVIAYSPSGNPYLKKIGERVQRELNNNADVTFKLVELNESNHLNDYLQLSNPFFGIEFSDTLRDTDKLPKQLNYAIRFRGDLRRLNWMTNTLTQINKISVEPRSLNPKGGPPSYVDSCFTFVQQTIDREFLEISTNSKSNFESKFKVFLKRFPYPEYTSDEIYVGIVVFLPFFFVISFMYTVRNIIKDVSLEKELQLKEMMKMVGLNNWLQWAGWFFKNLVFLLVILTVITIFLTCKYLYSNDIAIFPSSNPLLIWIFLLIYSIAFITFCFLMTLPFKKATTNAAFGYLLWMLIGLPYLLLLNQFYSFKFGIKFLLCLLTNTGMGYGFNSILKLESNGIGLQWSNIFSRANENKFSVGDCAGAMILGAFIMMFLTWYLEQVFPGKYGIPRKWYFPVEKLLKLKSEYNPIIESFNEDCQKIGHTYEEEPKDKICGIKIANLTKTFKGQKLAVDKLCLNIYADQITVLLGHNGAGKTTTMSMLTGQFPPSAGTAIIDGKDIRHDINEIRDSLGLCPQHNVLFNDLTVEEHIIFFSRLRGLKSNEVKEEVHKYVRLLELVPKLKSLSQTLSGGMKRKLSIAIALCGKSKIIMLDEPTSGMDPAARRKLWDLLISEKVGRTILLTTHFMDEADVLGDRIAVMAEGDLKAVGSSFFLKKKFGVGYRLVCVKEDNCNPNKVLELLKKFIADIKIETDIGTELTFVLNDSYVSTFQRMFEELENKSSSLGISSYGVSLTTLEEVFLKIGVDANVLHRMSSVDSQSPEYNGTDDPDHVATFREIQPFLYLSGTSLKINQFIAMLKKKFHYTRRNYKTMNLNLILSVFLIVIRLGSFTKENNLLPRLDISLSDYDKTTTLIQNAANSEIAEKYKLTVENFGSTVINVPPDANMDDFILQQYKNSFDDVINHFIVGVSFYKNDSIYAWFNDEVVHAVPLTLNMLNRAILKNYAANNYSVGVTNAPFYFEDNKEGDIQFLTNLYDDIILIFFILIIYTNWTSVFISFYIKERNSRAKLLQTISGVDKNIFWLTSYAFDMAVMIAVSIIITCTIAFFQVENYRTFAELIRLFVVFVMFSFSALPMTYMFSLLFAQPSTGESMNTLLGTVTGMILYGVYFGCSFIEGTVGEVFRNLYWVFLLSPHFTICEAFKKIILLNIQRNSLGPGLVPEELVIVGVDDDGYWSFKKGITGDLLAFFVVGFLYVIILLAIEHRLFYRVFYIVKPKSSLPELNSEMDSDVKDEMNRVNSMSAAQMSEQSLVMKNLTKFYGNFLAVRRVCVAVGDSVCFGLLGANGAGKTSIFKMLTGDETISNGDALIKTLSVKNQINEIHKRIGYCPQFDALLEDLTGREYLEIFCLLRGIPRSQTKIVAEKLAKKLDFNKHLDKQIKAYSGGNKRKLSTALSLVGDPEVIFLDEPTTGMDPGAKRKLWDVIIKMRSHGKSVILTSHSMEECEALCTRLAIMVNGEFKCLGSTQHLKNKFSKGFILNIKAGRSSSLEQQEHILQIKEFVNTNFPNAVLKEEYLDILTYQIEHAEMKWSKMFGLMESVKEELEIDDYSLGQTSLEQVFLFFTKTMYSNDNE